MPGDLSETIGVEFINQLPDVDPVETSAQLQISLTGSNVELSWDGVGGVLEAAAAISGPWTEVAVSSTNRVSVAAGESRQFYRLRK